MSRVSRSVATVVLLLVTRARVDGSVLIDDDDYYLSESVMVDDAALSGDENMRMGTLYFLSKVKIEGDNDTIKMSVLDLATNARVGGAAVLTLMGKSKPEFIKGASAAVGGLIKTITDAAGKLVSKMMTTQLGEFAKVAAKAIMAQLPAVVVKIMGSVGPFLGAAVEIGTNVYKSVKAAWDVFKTRNLVDGIQSGQPMEVIKSIKGQIKMFGLTLFGSAFVSALMIGLEVSNPALAPVVDALKTLFGFITRAFFYYRDLFKFREVIRVAKIHYAAKLYTNATEFRDWYTDVIKDMPIISSYCLAMPFLGSTYNFLSSVTADGKKQSFKEISKYNEKLEKVKTYAISFCKAHSLVLYTSVGWLNDALKQARGESTGTVKLFNKTTGKWKSRAKRYISRLFNQEKKTQPEDGN